MAYKISYNERLGWRWWDTDGPYRFGGDYCDVHAEHFVRPATDAEIVLIRRIINGIRSAGPIPTAVAKLRDLMLAAASSDAPHAARRAAHALNPREKILFQTIDPTILLDGKPVPAMTTLLHRVCDNDHGKFEEAMRIVELFLGAALKSD